jgi:uncharacterized protein involved in exopolysaccharide biosynthesis
LAQASTTKVPPSSSSKPTTSATDASEGIAQLRLDLAEALRGRGQAQARLKTAEAELVTLRSKTKVDAKRISDLAAERNALTARVRDLNEELDKKKKFLKVRGMERGRLVCFFEAV